MRRGTAAAYQRAIWAGVAVIVADLDDGLVAITVSLGGRRAIVLDLAIIGTPAEGDRILAALRELERQAP